MDDERIVRRKLHCLPRAARPRAAGMRGQRVLEPAREEHRAPALTIVAPQLEVILLARHASHDIADASPVIEAAVEKLQLPCARLERKEAERGVKRGAAVSRQRSVPPALPR